MTTISVRELLRNAKPVFQQMEDDQAPVLITRNGRPFAALVPVDPDHSEAMLLSAAPELIKNRNQAQDPGSRRIRLEDLPDSQEDDLHLQEGAAASEVSAEEQPMFDVILESAGEQKIGRIKVVREIVSGLGLKGAQDLLAGALANTGEQMINAIKVIRAYDNTLLQPRPAPPHDAIIIECNKVKKHDAIIKGNKVKGANVVRVGNKVVSVVSGETFLLRPGP